MSANLTHLALQVQDLEISTAFYGSYCGLVKVHDRGTDSGRVIWLAEPGREKELILVLMPGGRRLETDKNDYGHMGFAVASKEAVDAIAARAKSDGILVWPTTQEAYPVGYYCGVMDPDGRNVEFSFGQPLGPGAKSLAESD